MSRARARAEQSPGPGGRGPGAAYGKHRVVDDVGITVEPGEVVGLLGPNNAGKTTTFYLIVGLLKPQKGRIGSAMRTRPTCPST